ncbi:MAG: hypothetical protein ACLVJ6_09245 [Merdibacter sp.]
MTIFYSQTQKMSEFYMKLTQNEELMIFSFLSQQVVVPTLFSAKNQVQLSKRNPDSFPF